ncbi:hypothetical protein AAF712_015269 [Marasmius tenuissimus]|uniref:Uncharacterized protein n=1 Tax=Marasmius tenuissimus TaxID=585030 RepID=A0ABR2Z8T9_9AGAR
MVLSLSPEFHHICSWIRSFVSSVRVLHSTQNPIGISLREFYRKLLYASTAAIGCFSLECHNNSSSSSETASPHTDVTYTNLTPLAAKLRDREGLLSDLVAALTWAHECDEEGDLYESVLHAVVVLYRDQSPAVLSNVEHLNRFLEVASSFCCTRGGEMASLWP